MTVQRGWSIPAPATQPERDRFLAPFYRGDDLQPLQIAFLPLVNCYLIVSSWKTSAALFRDSKAVLKSVSPLPCSVAIVALVWGCGHRITFSPSGLPPPTPYAKSASQLLRARDGVEAIRISFVRLSGNATAEFLSSIFFCSPPTPLSLPPSFLSDDEEHAPSQSSYSSS